MAVYFIAVDESIYMSSNSSSKWTQKGVIQIFQTGHHRTKIEPIWIRDWKVLFRQCNSQIVEMAKIEELTRPFLTCLAVHYHWTSKNLACEASPAPLIRISILPRLMAWPIRTCQINFCFWIIAHSNSMRPSSCCMTNFWKTKTNWCTLSGKRNERWEGSKGENKRTISPTLMSRWVRRKMTQTLTTFQIPSMIALKTILCSVVQMTLLKGTILIWKNLTIERKAMEKETEMIWKEMAPFCRPKMNSKGNWMLQLPTSTKKSSWSTNSCNLRGNYRGHRAVMIHTEQQTMSNNLQAKISKFVNKSNLWCRK